MSLASPTCNDDDDDDLTPAGDGGEPDLQIRFVPGYALDPDAIKSYIKIGQLQETKKKWPAGEAVEQPLKVHLYTEVFP